MINIKNIYFLFFALFTIFSVNKWSSLPIGNTFFWWLLQFLFLSTTIITKKRFYITSLRKRILPFPIFLFLSWILICIIRGYFAAENYWESKNLVANSLYLMMPLIVYIFMNPLLNQYLLYKWFKYILPLFLVFLPFLAFDAYGHYLAPLMVLSLLFPLLPKKWKIIVLFFTSFIIIMGLNARSNVIKFSVALLFGYLLHSLRFFCTKKIFNFLRLILLIIPIIFFTLGVLGIFNVFNTSDYFESDFSTKFEQDGEVKEAKLTIDTRTFLYIEVLTSAVKNDYIYFGRTPSRGNDSNAFGVDIGEELGTGKNERYSNEASILNIFTWTGLIGVLFYFFIFIRASYFAINKSNNFFIKTIGLFVAFRWVYAWVEDFSRFDLSNLILWMLISMCFSESFRKMTDSEIKHWVRGIFSKRYVLQTTKLKQIKNFKKTK